jgi:hypothetical protein
MLCFGHLLELVVEIWPSPPLNLGNFFFQKNPLYVLKSYFSSQKIQTITKKEEPIALLFRVKCTTILVYVLYTSIRYVYQYSNVMKYVIDNVYVYIRCSK